MPIYKAKNEDFFKKWSSEMAYVLGFFCADGSMTKNKRGAHFIEFYIKDLDLLKKIRKSLKSNHKIKTRKRSGLVAYRLQIGSKKIFQSLLKLGLLPRKSKRVILPQIPKNYLSHFVRGYFDGDGSVWCGFIHKYNRKKPVKILLTRFTSGNKSFLTALSRRLADEIQTAENPLIPFCSGAYRLSYSTHDSIRLYNFIYSEDSELRLSRKKKIFEGLCSRSLAGSKRRPVTAEIAGSNPVGCAEV